MKIGNRIIRIAILDLYDGFENQGMRGIRELIKTFGEENEVTVLSKEFDVRQKNELPDLDFDIYISSGGPGSPVESEGEEWDTNYFEWLQMIEEFNAGENNFQKKYVYFICHSFQLASRYFKIGKITRRKSTAFGVFPIHLLEAGNHEQVFSGLSDPFYAVDSRDYQVIQPDKARLKKLGAKILCIEKERLHVPYERAIMGVRFNEFFIGTQFHPEADAIGMTLHLQTEAKKKTVVDNYGLEKWQSMIDQLDDPDKILWTYAHILPNFLNIALNSFQELYAEV